MYTEQFGLAEDPFKISPSLRYVHRGGGFETSLQALRSGLLAWRPLLLVVAESGLGKTALLKSLAAELLDQDPRYALVLQGCGSWTSAPALLDALGEARPAALLLDEAQNLTRATLRELLTLAPQASAQIVFAASPAFAARLEGHDVLLTRLRSLDVAEVATYVRERLGAAGRSEPDAFAPAALALVAAASNGVPRLINRICSTSIFLAATAGETCVSAARVAQAADTLGLAVPASAPPREGPAAEVVEPAPEPLPVAAAETPAPTANTNSEIPAVEPERPPVQPHVPAPDPIRPAAQRVTAPILVAEPRPSLRPARKRSRVPGGVPGVAAAAAAGSALALLTLVAAPQLLPPLPPSSVPVLAELARLQAAPRGAVPPETGALSPPKTAEATAAVEPESSPPRAEPPRAESAPLPPPEAPVSAPRAPAGSSAPETRTAANEPPTGADIAPNDRVSKARAGEAETGVAAPSLPASRPIPQAQSEKSAPAAPPAASPRETQVAAKTPPANAAAAPAAAIAEPAATEGPTPDASLATLRRDAEAASLAALEKAPAERRAATAKPREATGDSKPPAVERDVVAEAPADRAAPASPGAAPGGLSAHDDEPEPLADVVLKALQRSAAAGKDAPDAAKKPPAARSAAAGRTAPVNAAPQAPLDPVAQKLELARRQAAAGRRTAPAGDNAFETYRSVLAIAPDNDAARRGLDELAAREARLAEEAEIRGDWIGAVEHFETALAIAPDHPDVLALAEARRQAAAAVAPPPQPEAPSAAPADGAPRPLLAAAPPAARPAIAAPIERAAPPRVARPQPVRPLDRDLLDSAERIEAALRRGADPDSRYEGLHRPLTIAVQQRRPDIVAVLLRHGADPNVRTRDGATPLMYAAWHGDLVSGTFLLEAGARTSLQNADGKTALMAAAMRGHAAFVELLLRNGAPPDERNLHGWTALMYAAWGGHEQAVAQLLRAGANPALENDAGQTAAQLAESRQRLAVARLIAAAPTASN